MGKRSFAIFFAVLVLINIPSAFAASCDAPTEAARDATHKEFAHSAIDALFAEIRANTKARAGDRAELEAIVFRTLAPHVDFEAMTRSATGRAWREMALEDRSALVAEFRMLLIRLYSGMLAQYADHDYRIITRSDHSLNGEATVVVELRRRGLQGGPVVRVNALIRAGVDGAWKIIDLSVDGVSIVQSNRDGFREDLKRLGVSGLIKKLRQMNGRAN